MSPSVDVDVVVAGAGAAGLAASLAAAEAGKSVALLEAKETFRFGSNTSMSTAMVPAAGSRWQAAAGIDDSPERFYDDIMRKTKGSADPIVARALTNVAPELVVWMADNLEVPLSLVTDFHYPGHSRDRCHAVPDRAGRTLHRHLLEAVKCSEEITVIVPMRVTGVQLEAGALASVEAETPDGGHEVIRTGSLVLATNGFGAVPELVHRFIPEIESGLYFGGDGSTGDALSIGAMVGADTACLDAYQGHGSVATPHGVLVTWAVVMHGGFLVNALGRRFGNEPTGYSEYAVQVLRQPGGEAWVIFDGRIDRACRVFKDYDDLLEVGAVRWAEDVGALAEVIDVDAAVLGATIAEADKASRGRVKDPFGRTDWEAPLEAPFAAVKVTGALFHTQGGLRVDDNARVLRGGSPIHGLYAAGGAAVGISGHGAEGYLAGNGLLSALGLGYLAGRSVGQSG
ncbi:MAG: FAD-binding protein [Actinobacteria bacterium]|nr:FAD-binding protein [Actinomycetota bacterium]